MKKKLSFLFCLILLVSMSLCACGKTSSGPGASEDIVGTWALINNEEYKDILGGYISDDIFFSVYYIFNEDGTGSTHLNDDEDLFNFSYTYDGSTLHLTYENGDPESIPCTINGDEMHLSDNGEEVIFYKQ